MLYEGVTAGTAGPHILQLGMTMPITQEIEQWGYILLAALQSNLSAGPIAIYLGQVRITWKSPLPLGLYSKHLITTDPQEYLVVYHWKAASNVKTLFGWGSPVNTK